LYVYIYIQVWICTHFFLFKNWKKISEKCLFIQAVTMLKDHIEKDLDLDFISTFIPLLPSRASCNHYFVHPTVTFFCRVLRILRCLRLFCSNFAYRHSNFREKQGVEVRIKFHLIRHVFLLHLFLISHLQLWHVVERVPVSWPIDKKMGTFNKLRHMYTYSLVFIHI
jgi:hypothetical protein